MYAMPCSKFPVELSKNLTSAIMDYWWHNSEQRKRIHWVAWDKMMLPKELGGIGFQDLSSFNQSLLAKQAWRLLDDPN